MSDRIPDPRRLEMRSFARDGASVEGELPQSQFPRLCASLLPPLADAPAQPVRWAGHGSQRPVTGGEPEVWLRLRASTVVRLECQRCLQPMTEALEIDRPFRFVPGEDEATRLDESSEEDVLALVPRLDFMELLEDELILALPLVPRHETCPEPLSAASDPGFQGGELESHPFAALAALRRKPTEG